MLIVLSPFLPFSLSPSPFLFFSLSLSLSSLSPSPFLFFSLSLSVFPLSLLCRPSSYVQESEVPVDDHSKGVVFYLSREERRIVGVLTWNLFGKMDLARKVGNN